MPGHDEASRPVSVAPALAVLLVDGEPGLEPLSGEVDFLRAALAPTGDPSPLVKATSVSLKDFRPEKLKGKRVAVLANVNRLGSEMAAAIAAFVESGGGLLIAPGDRVDADSWNDRLGRDGRGWLPAKLGPIKGNPTRREAVAHPAPRTFDGPALGPLGQGDAPALGEADLFAYGSSNPRPAPRSSPGSTPATPGSSSGRGKGRVALLAGPIDAEGGTLPVNPDFVPWSHELIAHLAAGAEGTKPLKPGEPLNFELDPVPPPNLATLTLTSPSGVNLRGPHRPSRPTRPGPEWIPPSRESIV